jgi:uncharacterized membrane protein YhfC
MNVLYTTYILNGLLVIAIPIALAVYLTRKFELTWRLWWIGAAVFILSQVGHLPFDTYVVTPLLDKMNSNPALPATGALILSALMLGLSAGLWEEILRYAMFRWWAKDDHSWSHGLLAGAGHGGAGAIIIGLLVLYNFNNMLIVRTMDLSTLVSADQLPVVQAQVNAFWSAPWYSTFTEATQQLFTILVQICFTLLVLQTFIRTQLYWVFIAIGAHTLFEAARVVSQNLLNVYLMNVVLGVFAIGSIIAIFVLRSPETAKDLSIATTGSTPPLNRMKRAPRSVEEIIEAVKNKD